MCCSPPDYCLCAASRGDLVCGCAGLYKRSLQRGIGVLASLHEKIGRASQREDTGTRLCRAGSASSPLTLLATLLQTGLRWRHPSTRRQLKEMGLLCQIQGVAGSATQQRQQCQPWRSAENQLSRRRRTRPTYVGLSICILLSTSASLSPRDAEAENQITVRYFGVGAVPAGATAPTQASPPARDNRGTPDSSGDNSDGREGTPGSGEGHLPSATALLGIVHMGAGSAGSRGGLNVTPGGRAAFAGVKQAVAEKLASSVRADDSPDSPTTRGGLLRTYEQHAEEPALLQEQTAHGQRTMPTGGEECSCEFAGKCLPKGPCVAIACALVGLSLIGVFLLAWLLQWLSAIPSEWILAKRLRRRPLGFPAKDESGGRRQNRSGDPGSGPAKEDAQHVQRSDQGAVGNSDSVPLLEEQQTAAAESLPEETGGSGVYDAFATPVPKTENGRL